MPPFLSNEYLQLAMDLERWDGDVDSARALRLRLRVRQAQNPVGKSEDSREGMHSAGLRPQPKLTAPARAALFRLAGGSPPPTGCPPPHR